jgi:hypothetical protein
MANKVQIEVELLDQISSAYKRTAKTLSSSDKRIISSLKKVRQQTLQTDKATNKLSGAIVGLAGAFGGLLIINKINGLVSESITLFGKQAEAEAKVEQTIKATGSAAGVTAEELKNMSSELQTVTKFGDETILRGQSMLLTFKNIGKDVFPAATEAMLNLSEAMGSDVKEQAIQLGKALNDPITGLTALRRVGITFTEAQEDTIKRMQEMGDIAGSQKIILAELESQFGGLARATAQIGTGPLVQFQNRIGDIQEDIGEKLLPTVIDLAKGFERWLTPERVDKIVDGFDDWAVGAKEIAKWMAGIAKSGEELLETFTGPKSNDNFLNDKETNKQVKERVDKLIELESTLDSLKEKQQNLSFIERIQQTKSVLLQSDINKKLQEQRKIREELIVLGAGSFARENANLEELSKGLDAIINKKKEESEIEKEKVKIKDKDKIKPKSEVTKEVTSDDGTEFELMQLQNEMKLKDEAKERHKQLLEEKKQMEKDAADFELMQIEATEKMRQDAHEREQNRIKQEKEARAQAGSDFVNNLQTIAKANKKFGALFKAAAITETIINTIKGAQGAYSALAGIPVVGPGLGAAAAVAALGAGYARVDDIRTQKFAGGGIVGGNSFTGDRVPAMVNSGEMILNKRQQAQLFNRANGGGGSTINFEAPIIQVSGNADIGSIKAALAETYEEQIAKTAELLKETELQEVIA